MDITKRLQELDSSLVLHNEGHWNEPFNPDAIGFSSFNDAGVETEVGEFLYAMVRVLKPQFVLETGSHVGVGASYLGSALKDNHNGHLDTIEFLPELHVKAKQRIEKLGLEKYVTCHFGDVGKWEVPEDWRGSNESAQLAGLEQPKIKYDLILLDTEPQTRFAEFEKFYPYLNDGGYIFIHDLHRHLQQVENLEHGFAWPFGIIPNFLRERVHEGSVKPFHLPTPRGITGFYKVHPHDYKFEK